MIRNNNNNNQQNGRRRGRGGGQGGGLGGGAPRPQGGQSFGNNRLDIRQRGNATQLLDKYKALARDAAQQGDRVVSEYYLQYADHYFRVLNEIRERQPEHQRGPRPGYDADEDGEDVGNGYNPGYAASNDTQPQQDDRDEPQGNDRQRYDSQSGDRQQGDRQPRQYEDRSQQGRADRGQQEARAPQEARRDDSRRDDNRRDEPRRDEGRRDEPRRDREPRAERAAAPREAPRREPRDDYRDDAPRDGFEAREAVAYEAEPLLAGLPGPATLAPAALAPATPAPATPAEAANDIAVEAPKRRRGRPRKVVDTAPEAADA